MALSVQEKKERLAWISKIIFKAGDIVLSFYGSGAQIDYKAGAEPVTAADQASNEFLVSEIIKQFPNDGILAEESVDDHSRLEKDLVWMIDPMDGTKEFISQNGEFSVMVGLVEKGKPILGVVYQPTEERLYFGAKGVMVGVEESGNRQSLSVSDKKELSSLRMVVSRSHLEPVVEDIRLRFGITDLRQSGSVGLKCGLIAKAECDIYIHPSQHSKLWDSCAPQAILEAAGGRMTDIFGGEIDYRGQGVKNLNGLLATNGHSHDEAVALIRETYDAMA